MTWTNVTGPTQQAASNTGYMANSASQVSITLPASPTLGDVIQINGVGAGGWKILQNSGQSTITKNIRGGGSATTTGSIIGAQYDAIELQYIGSNTFSVLNYVGSILALSAGYVFQGGLVWMPVSNIIYTYANAATLCAGTINGVNDWRLPTQAELSSLFNSRKMNGQGWALYDTWSSTYSLGNNHYVVDLAFGSSYPGDNMTSNLMTCVR